MSHNGDWYASQECAALTREFVDWASDGDLYDCVRETIKIEGKNTTAVLISHLIADSDIRECLRFRTINPVLAAWMIRERIEANRPHTIEDSIRQIREANEFYRENPNA